MVKTLALVSLSLLTACCFSPVGPENGSSSTASGGGTGSSGESGASGTGGSSSGSSGGISSGGSSSGSGSGSGSSGGASSYGCCTQAGENPNCNNACCHCCPGLIEVNGLCEPSGGGSTGGGSSGGIGAGCTADSECSANLPPGYGIYCDYGSAPCGSGTVVEVPGSCDVYDTGATTCTDDAQCGPDAACSLPPGCVGGSGCQGTCVPLGCPVGPSCPADCPLQNYPHGCPACTCQLCPGADAGVSDGGCTSDLQCPQGLAPEYCDFSVEPCGQPLGGALEIPGNCLDDENQPTCLSNADCDSQDYCFNPGGACVVCGTCQPVDCTQPPQACATGCTLTAVPHQCPACVCPASNCCLLCN
ncbi:MAG: hypothetical protein ACYDCL_07100 [Myxococcales bacterium]